MSNIKRALRHAHSYRGGASYGTFGGYDTVPAIKNQHELEEAILGQVLGLQ